MSILVIVDFINAVFSELTGEVRGQQGHNEMLKVKSPISSFRFQVRWVNESGVACNDYYWKTGSEIIRMVKMEEFWNAFKRYASRWLVHEVSE